MKPKYVTIHMDAIEEYFFHVVKLALSSTFMWCCSCAVQDFLTYQIEYMKFVYIYIYIFHIII